jgi:hypothetical protein
MAKTHTKEAAETLLRELPSVVGAFVREDVNGHPREVHLLIGPGPNPRHLAGDVRDLLEERLGIPVDQRVISIAQLSVAPDDLALGLGEAGGITATAPDSSEIDEALEARIRFQSLETQTRDGSVMVRVRLDVRDRVITGEAIELDAGQARLRACATAALNAAAHACGQRIRFQLDAATAIRAFGREYVLVNVLASAAVLGRKPVPLVGAQPLEDDADHAAAFAALKAINRLLEKSL